MLSYGTGNIYLARTLDIFTIPETNAETLIQWLNPRFLYKQKRYEPISSCSPYDGGKRQVRADLYLTIVHQHQIDTIMKTLVKFTVSVMHFLKVYIVQVLYVVLHQKQRFHNC